MVYPFSTRTRVAETHSTRTWVGGFELYLPDGKLYFPCGKLYSLLGKELYLPGGKLYCIRSVAEQTCLRTPTALAVIFCYRKVLFAWRVKGKYNITLTASQNITQGTCISLLATRLKIPLILY